MAASVSLDLGKLVSITQTLENIFHQSFGPNALLTTVLTSTGKVMVTSDGASILASLQLDHPVAHMVCSSTLAHHRFTGDGTKTFIFMVSEALRSTLRRAKKVKNGCSEKPYMSQFVIEITQALGYVVSDILPHYVFPQLERFATATELTGDMAETTREMTLKVLQTSMLGKAPLEVSSHFSHLLSDFISVRNSHDVLNRVLYLIDNFSTVTMEISNDNYSCSQIIPGVLLPKKSVTLTDTLHQTSNIKFILLECSLEGDQDEQTDLPPGVLQVSGYHGFQQALQWKEQTVRRILRHYANSGVQLIITSWALSELVMSICRMVGIAAIGAIPLEDMERLAAVSDVTMVHETHYVLSEENMATIRSLRDIVCGGQNVIQLELKTVSGVVCADTLVICGPTPGLSRQYSNMVLNGLKCLRMWLQPLNFSHTAEENVNRKRKYDCTSEDQLDSTEMLVQNTAVEHLHKKFKGMQLVCDHKQLSDPDLPDVLSDSCLLETKLASLGSAKRHLAALSMPPGGSIEFIIHSSLENAKRCYSDPGIQTACRIIQDAVLSVPQKIHENSHLSVSSRHAFIQAKLEALDKVSVGKIPCIHHQTGAVRTDGEGCEPVASKMVLLCHVIELLQQLLRLDAIVSVKTLRWGAG